jgi:hypothetical protein
VPLASLILRTSPPLAARVPRGTPGGVTPTTRAAMVVGAGTHPMTPVMLTPEDVRAGARLSAYGVNLGDIKGKEARPQGRKGGSNANIWVRGGLYWVGMADAPCRAKGVPYPGGRCASAPHACAPPTPPADFCGESSSVPSDLLTHAVHVSGFPASALPDHRNRLIAPWAEAGGLVR